MIEEDDNTKRVMPNKSNLKKKPTVKVSTSGLVKTTSVLTTQQPDCATKTNLQAT